MPSLPSNPSLFSAVIFLKVKTKKMFSTSVGLESDNRICLYVCLSGAWRLQKKRWDLAEILHAHLFLGFLGIPGGALSFFKNFFFWAWGRVLKIWKRMSEPNSG